MTNHIHSRDELVALLAAEAEDVADPQELIDRVRPGAAPVGAVTKRRRWAEPAVVAASILFIIVLALTGVLVDRRHSRPTTPAPQETVAPTKQITFHGVTLTIPAAWPVIDGAHRNLGCGSAGFDLPGQSDRAFLGTSRGVMSSCGGGAKAAGAPTPIPADGIWLQPGDATPPGTAPTTLARGQQVYLYTYSADGAVSLWYHGVTVNIGIGPNPAVEQAALDSISYDAATPDSSVLGRCPMQGTTPPTLPLPTRAATLLKMDDQNGELAPEPASIQPIVSAATVWKNAQLDTRGFGVSGSQTWTMTFGSYSAQTPAHINPDNSETPFYTDVPAWVIEGKPIQTDYGPCAATIIAVYSAVTGELLGGVTMIG